MKQREDEQVCYISVSHGSDVDPTESESKCEDMRLESTLSTSVPLHRFRSILLIRESLPNTVAKVSVAMTHCANFFFTCIR